MRSQVVRFVQPQQIEASFSLDDLNMLDLTRNLAVLIRQSKKGAATDNGESRETQEALVKVGEKIIAEFKADICVRVFDEKDGMSGRKGADEREELSTLLAECRAGLIGTLFLSREDRLYRDEYGDHSGEFLRIANKQHITVVVPMPGSTKKFRIYKLWHTEDRERFKKAMDAAAGYLNQVRDMNVKNKQKAARGCYDGRPLPPGLAILQPPKELTREEKKEWKQALKPVLYEPWAHVMQKIFQELQACNWDLARVLRGIDARETPLFPAMSLEDEQIYAMKTSLKEIIKGGQKGFTIASLETIRRWVKNFHLLGWWHTWDEWSEDTDEEITGGWIQDNHPAVLDRSIIEEGHMKLFGYTIEGEPAPHIKIKQYKRHTKSLADPLLLELLRYPDDQVTISKCLAKDTREESNRTEEYANYIVSRKSKHDLFRHTLFIIPAFHLDTVIIRRIEEFCTVDQTHDMAQRVKNRLKQLRERQAHNYAHLDAEIKKCDRTIKTLQKRILLFIEGYEISEEQLEEKRQSEQEKKKEDEVIKQVKAWRKDIQRKRVAKQNYENQKKQLALVDNQKIEQYYKVLNNFSEEFPKVLYGDQVQLLSSLIKQITIKELSPHWLQLTVKWSESVSLLERPDVCIIWRNLPIRVGKFTEEEKQIVRKMYPNSDRLEIMRCLPDRSWLNIRKMAKELQITRPRTNVATGFPGNMCWADINAWQYPEQAIALANELATPQRKQEAASFLAERWLFPAAFIQTSDQLYNSSLVQNREVFAVPSGIFSPSAGGVNKLIQDGAHPVTCVNDILSSLNLFMLPQHAEAQAVLPENDEERSLLGLIGYEPVHIDELIRGSGLAANTVAATLTTMELKGMIRLVGSMQYVLV